MATTIITAPKPQPTRRRSPRPLARLPLVVAIASLAAAEAQALSFSLGEVEGKFDSQLSIGASWRMEDQDRSLISFVNGGTAPGSGVNDDGNLNFKKGDAFSTIFKGVHDLELSYQNVGIFARGKYWYDYVLEEEKRPHGHGPNEFTPDARLDDSGFNDFAKFSGAELLDAFVYGDFDLGDVPVSLRLGRQVISWGESTFIQGGINAINPVDVNAFRRPGAEIKEGLLPVNMAFASFGVTDNLSVEGFYQLEFEPTVIDGCGTYFSTVDYIAEGCDVLSLGNISAAMGGPPLDDQAALAAGFSAFRAENGNREASDDGQYGVALRYYAAALNDTEFGLYYLNYHSRLPVASGITSTMPDGLPPFIPSSNPMFGALSSNNPQYFVEYPEDVQLIGVSFATNVGSFALSGEVSHHLDVPVQINGTDLVGALVTGGTDPSNPASSLVQGAGKGEEIPGFKRFDITQTQVTVSRIFNRVLGASGLVTVGEVGFTHVHDLPDVSEGGLRFGRASVFGGEGDDGFVTEDSWGYRLRATLNYNDVFAGINLKPSLAWSHDVDGVSPTPSGAFQEDRKAVSVGLSADYLNTYNAGLSYTRYFGGDFNTIKDRDFIAASVGVSF